MNYEVLNNDFLYGAYRTRKFTDIYPSVDAFEEDYNDNGIPTTISSVSIRTLFYLLYARYGNDHISSSDETRFKYNLFSIVFSKGPTWEKKLEVQKKVREFTEEDLMQGTKAIHNSALNPGTAPSTDSIEELNYINQQNTTKYRKAKVEGYALLMNMLENDVTTDFIDSFQRLFNPFGSELPLYYVTDEGEQE